MFSILTTRNIRIFDNQKYLSFWQPEIFECLQPECLNNGSNLNEAIKHGSVSSWKHSVHNMPLSSILKLFEILNTEEILTKEQSLCWIYLRSTGQRQISWDFVCEIVNKLPQHSLRPKDWNQSLLRRGPFLPASVSRIANRTHLSPALFASPEFIFPAHIPIQQLLLIELLKYESLISSCNWSLFLLHQPRHLRTLSDQMILSGYFVDISPRISLYWYFTRNNLKIYLPQNVLKEKIPVFCWNRNLGLFQLFMQLKIRVFT